VKTAKRRYLAVQIDSPQSITSHEFMNTTWNTISKLFGEHGASQTGLSLVNYDETKKLAILRTWHNTLEMVRTTLASITQIAGKPAALHVITVSGTIKTIRTKLEKSHTAN
jgi:RNase P/RNase MRP subunit POP5